MTKRIVTTWLSMIGLYTSSCFAETDCIRLAVTVKQTVSTDKLHTLQIVEKEVAGHHGCACEIVKAAIEGAKADVKLVARIVEVAVLIAPEHTRLISQCAVAVAPDALVNVQAVLARLQGKKMQPIGQSSKKPQVPEVADSNPLDFPGSNLDFQQAAIASNGAGESGDSGGAGNTGNSSGGGGGSNGGGNGGGGGAGGGGGGGGGIGGGGMGGGFFSPGGGGGFGGGSGGVPVFVPPIIHPPTVTPSTPPPLL